MEFLKKNWGLLLCAVVFTALMVYQLLQIRKYQKEYADNQSKVEQAKSTINSMNSDGWKILPDSGDNQLKNAADADANRQTAENRNEEIREQLLKNYSIHLFEQTKFYTMLAKAQNGGQNINPDTLDGRQNQATGSSVDPAMVLQRAVGNDEIARKVFDQVFALPVKTSMILPADDTQAKGKLDQRLSRLDKYIWDNKIEWGFGSPTNCYLYSLKESSQRLLPADFPAIFRQLLIYENLVQHIVSSGVKTVNTLEFPRGLATTEMESNLTVTPIILSVVGDETCIQQLVNNLSFDPNMLFVIRNMDFTLPADNTSTNRNDGDAEFNKIVYEKLTALNTLKANKEKNNNDFMTGGGRMGGMGGMPVMSTMDDMMPRASGGFGGNMGSTTVQNRDPNLMFYEPPKRQDYLVFHTPRKIQLNLTIDLLEFISSEEEADEEEEEPES